MAVMYNIEATYSSNLTLTIDLPLVRSLQTMRCCHEIGGDERYLLILTALRDPLPHSSRSLPLG